MRRTPVRRVDQFSGISGPEGWMVSNAVFRDLKVPVPSVGFRRGGGATAHFYSKVLSPAVAGWSGDGED